MLVGQGWMDAKLLFAGHVWVGGGLQCNLSGEICGSMFGAGACVQMRYVDTHHHSWVRGEKDA